MQGYYCNVHFRSHRAFASTINDRQACWLPKGRTVATRQSIETGALFPPVPGHAASRRAGNKICKPRGAGGRQPQLSPPPPPAKSRHTDPIAYLERVTIHFAVLRIHVAEAAMPTQGGPSVAAGEAFCPCCSCQSSEQRYLKWSEQGKAIPFPPVPQFPPLDTVPKGRSPYTPPPTHPWHTDKPLHAGRPLQVPPQHVAAFQHIVSICAQRGRAACFELTAFLLPIDISRRFHFCTSTRRLWFSQPPPSLPTAACVSSLRWVSHRGSLPRDQRSDLL